MRKLATVRKIDVIAAIEGADSIETAVLGGWKVVVKKGEFAVGDLAVYIEIDSWVPNELAAFLSKGKEPREYLGVKGERLRTVKLRGQLSQGLLLPIREVMSRWDDSYEGADLTEMLGIQKWEPPVNAQLAGVVKGNFPSQIPKTDQERVQNLKDTIEACAKAGTTFEITEKLEGSSMTCYLLDGEFGVCSRNMDLKRDENNSFWKVAFVQNIEEKMRDRGLDNIAIQGELIGPGIQGNIYNLSFLDFYVYDVYDVQTGKYMNPVARRALVSDLGLKHVPLLGTEATVSSVDAILALAEGNSILYSKQEREGIVFKENNGGVTFKAISNKYLLKQR